MGGAVRRAALGRAQPAGERRGDARHRSGRAGGASRLDASCIWTTVVASVVFGILYAVYVFGPHSVRFPEADFQAAAFLKRQVNRRRVAKKRAGHVALLVAMKSSSPLLFALCSRRRRFPRQGLASSQDLDRTLEPAFCAPSSPFTRIQDANRSSRRCHHYSVNGRSRSGRRARSARRHRSG